MNALLILWCGGAIGRVF